MSYLVLARKYRPQTFTEVVGQEHVTRTLANAFEQDRVHHAFLFCGPRGVGKTTLARILGKALNCEHGPTAEPCGQCSACTTITSGTAVDYYEMDGASNRGIDAIRDLTDAVRYQPAALRKKVYVIDEVHMLTTEAFNALLKTLEEPPPHITFVLATTEPHKVPNTILSRCQRYDFKLVPMQRLIGHLSDIFRRETLEIEPGAVSLIARESGGSVRDALSLSDQIISYAGHEAISESRVAEVLGVADRGLTRAMVGALAEGDAGAALEAVDAAVDRGVDEVQLARAIVSYLRDLAVMQVAPDSKTLVEGSDEDRAELAAQAARLDRTRLGQMFDRMLRACQDLAQTPQPRLVLDLALIDVAALEPVLPLGDLLDRLGALEQRLGPGGGSSSGRASGGRGQPTGGAGSAGRSASAAPASGSERPPGARADALAPQPPPAPGVRPNMPAPAVRPDTPAPPATIDAARAPVPVPEAPSRPAPAAASSTGHAGNPFAEGSGPKPIPAAPAAAPVPAAAPAAPAPAEASRAQGSAASVPRSADEMLREWERVISALERARKLPLVGLYEHARIIGWKADAIEVGFASDDLTAERACEREQVDAMREFLQQHYGRSLTFTVRTLRTGESTVTDQARSLIEVERQRVTVERHKREAEAREHPATKMVLDTFGAHIKEIKTDV